MTDPEAERVLVQAQHAEAAANQVYVTALDDYRQAVRAECRVRRQQVLPRVVEAALALRVELDRLNLIDDDETQGTGGLFMMRSNPWPSIASGDTTLTPLLDERIAQWRAEGLIE